MERGYIKLWRKFTDSSFYNQPIVCRLAEHCLLKANYKKSKVIFDGEEIILNPGQFITGRKQLSKDTGISEQKIRTSLKKLITYNFLTIKSTKQNSLVTILNWDIYQSQNIEINQGFNQHLTNDQPTINHKQEYKERKNNKNVLTDRRFQRYIKAVIPTSARARGTAYKNSHKKTDMVKTAKAVEGYEQYIHVDTYLLIDRLINHEVISDNYDNILRAWAICVQARAKSISNPAGYVCGRIVQSKYTPSDSAYARAKAEYNEHLKTPEINAKIRELTS